MELFSEPILKARSLVEQGGYRPTFVLPLMKLCIKCEMQNILSPEAWTPCNNINRFGMTYANEVDFDAIFGKKLGLIMLSTLSVMKASAAE